MERKLTCIVCPLGCEITVKLQDKEIINVTGNTCPRGKVYAQNECVNPQRVVTSTVRCSDGSIVAVKTETPIQKDKVFECMQIINKTVASLPITVGSVIIENVFGSKVVATQNRS